MFSLSQLMLVRQKVVEAARYEAWSAPKGGRAPGGVQEAFFGRYQGTWSAQVSEKEVTADLSQSGQPGRIAQAVVNNAINPPNGQSSPTLRLVTAEGSYHWQGLVPVEGADVTMKTRCAVVLPNDATRPEFQDNQAQEHFILDRQLGAPAEFKPVDPNDGYLTPIISGYFSGTSGADPGIWSRDARIGGSAEREHGIYQSHIGN
jgi:hypothetical protein